jgi:hypothetical protein
MIAGRQKWTSRHLLDVIEDPRCHVGFRLAYPVKTGAY